MAATNPQKLQEIQLQKLLAGKALRKWTTDDVVLWLTLTNNGLFAKYTHIFTSKQIDGQTLMTLDDEKSAIDLLGTQHQINTFVQSIKQLKSKNGRKMSAQRRRQSRRSLSNLGLDALNGSASARNLFTAPSPSNSSSSMRRSATPNGLRERQSKHKHKRTSSGLISPSPRNPPNSVFTYTNTTKIQHVNTSMSAVDSNGKHSRNQHYKSGSATPKLSSSNSFHNFTPKKPHHQISQTVTDIHFNGSLLHSSSPSSPDVFAMSPTSISGSDDCINRLRNRSLSNGDAQDPTDKKALWKLYKAKETYSALLFKRGKLNKSFKKRWLALCEQSAKKDAKNGKADAMRNSKSVSIYMDAHMDGVEYESKQSAPSKPRLQMNNYSLNALSENPDALKFRNHKALKANTMLPVHGSVDIVAETVTRGYLFYFNERPVNASDFPNGYIDLSTVQFVIGLFGEDDSKNEPNESPKGSKKKVEYLKKKSKQSEYYEIVLKTTEREWIFGAVDAKSYVEWLIRLKKFEKT